jgi:hypothetical protein
MLQFTPSTTLPKLLANNTSASDSFPGWPNGVAKPSAIGLTPMGVPQQWRFVHRVNWWGGNRTGVKGVGYISADPIYVAKTIADMLQRGYNGASLLWNGITYPEAKATLAMSKAFSSAGMVFIPMMGGANPAFGLPAEKHPDMTREARTAAVIKELDYFNATFFSLPAQFKINGRPVMQFFGVTGVDWTAIIAHLKTFAVQPLLFFRWENDGKYTDRKEADGYFGWRSCNQAWVDGVSKYGKLVMLGINAGFDSSHKELPVNCSWGNTDPRPQLGGLRRVQQLALAAANPKITMLQECTWDDYQEGSPIEPGIATGAVLTLTFNNESNTLEWADPGEAFASTTLYLSQNGIDLMPLSKYEHGAAGEKLSSFDIPLGEWHFVLVADGKNSIQRVASNMVKVAEFTDWQ